MKKSVIFSLIIFVALVATPTFAEERSTGEKALQGVTNILGGWTEVFASPVRGVKEHGPLGFFSGVFLIPWEVAKREVGGVATLLTAPTSNVIMGVDNHPLSDI